MCKWVLEVLINVLARIWRQLADVATRIVTVVDEDLCTYSSGRAVLRLTRAVKMKISFPILYDKLQDVAPSYQGIESSGKRI